MRDNIKKITTMRSILLPILALTLVTACQPQQQSERQAEVAERGTEVMPFDLERSTHIFEKIENGGVQQVVSDDGDAEEVSLIQSHLAEIAERFSDGDFHGPEMIHGEHMPGLHELVMGHERISIEYAVLDNGGEITYSTEDPALIEAIHEWFDAQVSDHGHHAEGH